MADLRTLFGTEKRLETLCETAEEVWARELVGFIYALRVAVDGHELLASEPPANLSPARRRELAWRPTGGLAIERIVHDEGTVTHRAHLNGPVHTSFAPAGTPPPPWPRGFRVVSPWDMTPFGTVYRQYLLGRHIWVIHVEGAVVHTSGGDGKAWHADAHEVVCASSEQAIERAEAMIAERVAAGFRLRLIELLGATRWFEPPPLTRSPDPYAAVDAAMDRIRALVERFPRAHFVVEMLDREQDRGIYGALGYSDYFVAQHEHKFGRWRTIATPPRTGSSYDYFLARYGSVTWIVSTEADEGLSMFYCGNTAGGGWCCLEIERLDDLDLSYLADEFPGRGYDRARAFHGGWGRTGYLFDTRTASPSGEHAIAPFTLDGPMDDLLDETPTAPDAIEPFGFWLEQEVHSIEAQLVHRLPFFHD